MSTTLKDYEKYLVILSRADGTIEEIKVGSATNEPFQIKLPDDFIKKINLQPGEKIIYWYDIAVYDAHLEPTATFTPLPGT